MLMFRSYLYLSLLLITLCKANPPDSLSREEGSYHANQLESISDVFSMQSQSDDDRSSYYTRYVIDYRHDARMLGLANVRSLEALLTQQPFANVTYLSLVSPRFARSYRFDQILAWTHFLKYERMGFNVHPSYGVRLALGSQFARLIDLNHPFSHLPSRKTAPPMSSFVNMFFRMREIYEHGGVSTELELMPIAPVKRFERIFDSRVECGDDDMHTLSNANNSRRDMAFFAFPAKDPVVECVLKQYDLFAKRFRSISCDSRNDTRRRDAECTRRLVDDCLDDGVRRNAVRWMDCDNRRVNALYFVPNADTTLWDRVDADEKALIKAREEEREEAGLGKQSTMSYAMWMGTYASEGRFTAPANNSLVDHLFGAAHAGIARRLHAEIGRTAIASKLDVQCLRQQVLDRARCAHFAVPRVADARKHSNQRRDVLGKNAGALLAEETERVTEWAEMQCTPSFMVPGARKGGSTFLFHALAQHPQVVNPLRGSSYKEAHGYFAGRVFHVNSVYPDGYWVGDRMSSFPFLEEGDPFITGDGGVEHLRLEDTPRLVARDNPNLKAIVILRDPAMRVRSDYFFTGGKQERSSSILLAKLRNIKPQAKLCADELWKHVGNVSPKHRPSFVSVSGGNATNYKDSSLEKPLDVSALLEVFFTEGSPCSEQAFKLPLGLMVRRSFFAPFLLHWTNELGSENVVVLTLASLSVNPKSICSQVWKLLGLCEFELPDEAIAEHHNSNNKLAHKTEENETEIELLKTFYVEAHEMFRPFNRFLYTLLGKRFEWWDYDDL